MVLAGLFALSGSACRAFTYIVDMAGAPLTPLTTSPGLATASGDLFHTFFDPAPAFEYKTPSVVSYGLLSTAPAVPGNSQSGDFNSLADFYFLVGRGDGSGSYQTPPSLFGPDVVHAMANITGNVAISADGVPSSSAHFTGGSATVVSGPNTGATSFASTDPINGQPANELDLDYFGTPVQVWVDLISSVPAPSANQLSIGGYITDQPLVVPEPGLTALSIATLLTFGLLRTRGRREKKGEKVDGNL
jgi:hypothetical protein